MSFGNLVHIKHQIMEQIWKNGVNICLDWSFENDTYNIYQVVILINYNFASGFGTKHSQNCIQSSVKPVLLITGLEVVVVAA